MKTKILLITRTIIKLLQWAFAEIWLYNDNKIREIKAELERRGVDTSKL